MIMYQTYFFVGVIVIAIVLLVLSNFCSVFPGTHVKLKWHITSAWNIETLSLAGCQ